MSKLAQKFYERENVLAISRELLGKVLYTQFDDKLTSGVIVETEAYAGVTDRASHAYGGKLTHRTEVMYASGGIAYIYLCYGIHHLFNVVTNWEGIPHAVLIRAIEPKDGIGVMMQRRNKKILNYSLTSGPGTLTQALGITIINSGVSLRGDQIWLEDQNINYSNHDIIESPRVGVQYAKDDALNLWRFQIQNSPWISRAT